MISSSSTLHVAKAPGEVLGALQQWAASNGLIAVRVAPDQVDIRRGSNAALRIKGGLFTKAEDFPVVAAVQAIQGREGCVVRVNVLDDLGPAIRTGIKKKMQASVDDFAQVVESAIVGPRLA